jgi:hypothetical protein
MEALCYHGTKEPVRVGDRILVHRWLRRSVLATVVYVPGQVEKVEDLGDDSWAYKLDDGTVYAPLYAPREQPFASHTIELVCRAGQEAAAVIQSYQIPPEVPTGTPGSDLLALIGCGTLVALAVALGFGLWKWLSGP